MQGPAAEPYGAFSAPLPRRHVACATAKIAAWRLLSTIAPAWHRPPRPAAARSARLLRAAQAAAEAELARPRPGVGPRDAAGGGAAGVAAACVDVVVAAPALRVVAGWGCAVTHTYIQPLPHTATAIDTMGCDEYHAAQCNRCMHQQGQLEASISKTRSQTPHPPSGSCPSSASWRRHSSSGTWRGRGQAGARAPLRERAGACRLLHARAWFVRRGAPPPAAGNRPRHGSGAPRARHKRPAGP